MVERRRRFTHFREVGPAQVFRYDEDFVFPLILSFTSISRLFSLGLMIFFGDSGESKFGFFGEKLLILGSLEFRFGQ